MREALYEAKSKHGGLGPLSASAAGYTSETEETKTWSAWDRHEPFSHDHTPISQLMLIQPAFLCRKEKLNSDKLKCEERL